MYNLSLKQTLPMVFLASAMAFTPASPIVQQASAKSAAPFKVRGLTRGEKRIAKSFFGSSFDAAKVRIFPHRLLGLFPPKKYGGLAFGNKIYASRPSNRSNDYSKNKALLPFLMHELTHVRQHQNGVRVISLAFQLHSQKRQANPYKYKIKKGSRFSDFNIEQQAKIVEYYFGFDVHLKSGRKINFPEMDKLSTGVVCKIYKAHRNLLSNAGFNVLKPSRNCPR